MAKIYRYLIIICFAVVFFSSCGSSPESTDVHDYRVEVKGLTLKYVLVDSLYEIQQVNVDNAFPRSYYESNPSASAHFDWLTDTYEAFSGEQKTALEIFRRTTHPWVMMNETTSLADDADLSEISDLLMAEVFSKLEDEDRALVESLFKDFYTNFLHGYLEQNSPHFEELAVKMNREMQEGDANVLAFMEDTAGVPFEKKYKPVFYYTLRPVGAMGFSTETEKISLIQRNNTEADRFLSTAFHEYSHSQFEDFFSSRRFKRIARKLKKVDAALLRDWEREFHSSYDWISWCEENLIEGWAHFLDSKYYGVTRFHGTYRYDREFYQYLERMDFSSEEHSFEDVCLEFLQMIYERLKD